MKLAIAAVIAVLSVAPAAAQSSWQANSILPGCRELMRHTPQEPLEQGMCVGIVATLALIGRPAVTRNFLPGHRYCIPSGVNPEQALHVVLPYIEARPARWHEQF